MAGYLQVVNYYPNLSPAYFFAGTPPFFSVQDKKDFPLQGYLDGFELSLPLEAGNKFLQFLDMTYATRVWTNRVHKNFTFFCHVFSAFNRLFGMLSSHLMLLLETFISINTTRPVPGKRLDRW